MRLIDADELAIKFRMVAEDPWNKSTSTTWANAYEECADDVDEFPPVDIHKRNVWKWIPVSERLPEKGSFALVTDFGDVEEAYYDSDGHWWQVWGDRLKNVTAWMPLPEPYREEADNAQLD